MSKSYRVGIYVRESRDDNEENYETIETQRDLLIDFVERNKLGTICGIYVDDNVSGSVFDREGLERLKADIMAKRVDMLVLKDLSRLGRNNAKTLLFLDFLEEYGVRVITFDARYDSLRDNDTVGIETWFNERYVRDISKKIRANLRFKIQKGEYIGHAPYGYQKSKQEKNKLVPDPEEREVVREIFDLYLRGYGYLHIAKQMNRSGIPSPSGRIGGWNAVSIRRILNSRVYLGDTVQGVSEKVSYKSKKTRRLSQNRWVVTPQTHEAIISREVFEAVASLIKKKSGERIQHKGTVHPFRGVLYCGGCGGPMFARKRSNRPMGYICGSYAREGLVRCTSHHVAEDFLQGILKAELMALLEDTAVVQKAVKLLAAEDTEGERRRDRRGRLEAQLNQKKRQQEELYMDKLEGQISAPLFFRMNQQMENRIKALEDELAGMAGTEEEELSAEAAIEGFREHIVHQGLTYEMVSVMVEKITVYDPDDVARKMRSSSEVDILQATDDEGVIVVEFRFGKG